jgi:hypothetical protein
LAEEDRINMATRNPATIKKEKVETIVTEPQQIKIKRRTATVVPNEDEPDELYQVSKQTKKRAQIKSVYVEVGANLGAKQLKFGIHADLNDEDAAEVKNRLYFECLGSLERHIKEMGAESGPFRGR